jgi:hypothetical protein
MINFLRKNTPHGVKVVIKRFLPKRYFEEYTIAERRKMWPPAAALQEKHLKNCRVLESRDKMLEYMPKNAVCVEVGIYRCEFSKKILEITQPKKLYLFDIADRFIRIANENFKTEIAQNKVEVRKGDSTQVLLSMPDGFFDWIYIDGLHTYEKVKEDLEAARLKIKRGGIIALNDYIFFGPSDFTKIGVIEAVNEFCIKNEYELIFYALQGRTYNDVAIRKIS